MFVSCKRELNITRIEFMCIRVLLKQQLLIRESPFIDYRISRATFRDLEKEERYIFESKPKKYIIWIILKNFIICGIHDLFIQYHDCYINVWKISIGLSFIFCIVWNTLYFYCCCYHANANPLRRDSFLLVLQYSARKYAAYTSLIYILFALYTTMYTSFRLVRFSLFLNIFSSCLGKHRGNDT